MDSGLEVIPLYLMPFLKISKPDLTDYGEVKNTNYAVKLAIESLVITEPRTNSSPFSF